MAQLLSEYKDVFSCGDHDMGRAKTVCHEIPLAAGTVPIWQLTCQLGPEKEREVSRQVQDLLNQDLIEPGHGAWSSPVVLVRKKEWSWGLEFGHPDPVSHPLYRVGDWVWMTSQRRRRGQAAKLQPKFVGP